MACFVQDIFMIDFHGHVSIKSTNLQSRTQPVKRCYKSKLKFAEYITFACHCLGAQMREQMSGPDLHVFTLKFLALTKTVFSPIKNTFQNFFDFCLPLFYATFQCGP